jgi:predicted dehydrogenase
MEELKAGIIGFDTSHVAAFTKILNDEKDPFHVKGIKVVAGYPSFSPDIESSASRVEGFKKTLTEEYSVKLASSVEELLGMVDVIFLESVDGRRHFKEAVPVIEAKKPLFIDKPMTTSYKDAKELFSLAEENQVPVFSSSSLRFDYNISKVKESPELQEVYGCDAFSPCTLEKTNPGFFWYGIHGVEILYTFMGPGCRKLRCFATEGTHYIMGQWEDGRIGTVRGTREGVHGYGATVYGKEKTFQVLWNKEIPIYAQLLNKISEFFKTGVPPVKKEDTLEIMKFIEAGLISEKENREVSLDQLDK